MLDHGHKCIFIHVPKTAGQSIEKVFLSQLGIDWDDRSRLLLRFNGRKDLGPPRLAHLRACEYVRYGNLQQDKFDSYFKFAFVWNPWDRLVSIYKYFGYSQHFKFSTFVLKQFQKNIWREKYWFVRPQNEFLYDDAGKCMVDFVGKYENLQTDFDKVCESLNLPQLELPHANKSSLKPVSMSWKFNKIAKVVHYNIYGRYLPKFSRFQDYFCDETRALVAELYADDIELFGYAFEDDLP